MGTQEHSFGFAEGGMGGRVRLLPEGYDVDCLQSGAYLGAYMGMAKAGPVCTNNNNNNNNNNMGGQREGTAIYLWGTPLGGGSRPW